MSHHHQCTIVDQAINRQVGPHSSLYCRSCDSTAHSVSRCNSIEQTISRQVGPKSSLFCHECHIDFDAPRTGSSPAEEAICRIAGPRSPLCYR